MIIVESEEEEEDDEPTFLRSDWRGWAVVVALTPEQFWCRIERRKRERDEDMEEPAED